MNPDNSAINSEIFILNDAQLRAPLNKIYTIKYYFLLTSTLVIFVNHISKIVLLLDKTKQQKNYSVDINFSITILGFILAFIINCSSQFFGHRRLYLTSYLFTLGFSALSYNKSFSSNLIVLLLLQISQKVIFTQITLQIWGNWPNQFIRIFTEFIMFSTLTIPLLYLLSNWIQNIHHYLLFALIIINTILGNIEKSINDFRSPETDSVLKDFFRMLCNKKPFIFTLLIGFSVWLTLLLGLFFLLIVLINLSLDYKLNISDPTNNNIDIDIMVINIMVFLYICALFLSRNLHYQSTLITASFLILLILLGLFAVVIVVAMNLRFNYKDILNFKYESLIIFSILLLIFTLQQIHIIPQYQKILLNIGIRNLDFASSFQQLLIGLFYLFMNIVFKIIQPRIDKESGLVLNFPTVYILTFIGIIVFLSFLFYYLLGFYQYFQNSNRSYVEENEFQIEID